MAKRILKDDVVEKGVLDNLLTPLVQLKTLLETTSGMLMHFAKNAKESLEFKTDAKGLREQEALMKKINTAYESKVKTDKELVKIAAEIAKTEKENIKLYEAAVKSAEKRSKAEETAHKKREAAYNKEMTQSELLAKKTFDDNEKKRLSDIKLQQQREKSIDRFNKAEEKRLEKIAKDESRSLSERQKAEQSLQKQREKSLKDISNAEERSKKDRQSAEQALQKQREKSLKDISNAEERSKKDRQSAEQALQRQREKGIASMQKEQSKATELNRPYVQLDTTLKKLTKEYQDLAASGLSNTKRAKELRGEIGKLDTTLKKIDADTGKFGRNVGGYTEAIKKGFQGAKSVIAQFGLALGGIALARSAIDTIVQFDSSIADLSAITGKTGKDLDFFRENAIRMGVDVKGGASAVVEAYKLIASAKPELLDNAAALNSVTEAAILLSRASGMELPESATALTDAMNQLGAGADQAGKFVDVLAAGAKFGSAEIPQITAALLEFGPVAKSYNVSIQESTAAIEGLAEKGIKGSEAGTKLRNVLLALGAAKGLPKEAQESFSRVGIDVDVLSNNSLTLEERLTELSKAQGDEVAMLKIFGKENISAAKTVLAQKDRIAELTEQVDENGVAQEQANARSVTLAESYNRFKETINGLVLEFANGSNAAGGLVSALDFLRENISTIIATGYQLIKVFVLFKTAMYALKLRDSYNDWKKLGGNIKDAAANLKEGASAGQKFGAALKSAGFAVIAETIMEVATAIYSVVSGAVMFEYRMKEIKRLQESGSKSGQKYNTELTKQQQEQINLINLQLSQGKITEKQANDRIKSIKILAKEATENEIDRLRAKKKEIDQEVALAKKKRDSLAADKLLTYTDVSGKRINALNEAEIKYTNLIALSQGYGAKITELKTGYDSLNQEVVDATISENEFEKSLGKGAKEAGKQAEAIEDYTQRLRELNDVRINDDKLRDEAQLKTKLDADLASIKDNGIKSYEYRMALEHTYQDDLLKLQREYVIKRIEAEQEYWDAVKEAQLQAKADFEAIEDEKFNQEVKAILERDKQLELISLQNTKDGQKADELIEKEKRDRKKESLQQQLETARFYGKETLDLELELAYLERDEKKKLEAEKIAADEAERARLERMQKFRNELIKQGTEYLTNQIDEQIALLDKRSDRAAELEDFLMEKAKAGKISASESIIEQQRIQEDADRKKIELERRKANIVAISSLLQSFNNKVNNGDKFALAETAVESGALLALLNSLPKFYGGTDTTVGAESKALKPGKDGHLSWVDKDERILNPSLSGKIPTNVTNAQLVDGYLDSISGKFGTGAMMYKSQKQDVAGNSFDIAPLLQAQKETVDAINELPKYQLTPDKIAEGMIRLTAQTQRGKVKVKNEYIIRK